MREIVLDTETTGFDPLNGHLLDEPGAVELVDLLPQLCWMGRPGYPRSYAGVSRVPNRPMTDTPRRPECRFR